MSKSKRNKVNLAAGSAWYLDEFGERKNVTTLSEANEVESKCCGINCCNNTIRLPVNDANGTTTYPSFMEFVKVGESFFLRITTTLPTGITVNEVELT